MTKKTVLCKQSKDTTHTTLIFICRRFRQQVTGTVYSVSAFEDYPVMWWIPIKARITSTVVTRTLPWTQYISRFYIQVRVRCANHNKLFVIFPSIVALLCYLLCTQKICDHLSLRQSGHIGRLFVLFYPGFRIRIRIRIRINLSCWIRIRIQIQIVEGMRWDSPDSDMEASGVSWKMPRMRTSC